MPAANFDTPTHTSHTYSSHALTRTHNQYSGSEDDEDTYMPAANLAKLQGGGWGDESSAVGTTGRR